MSDFSPALLLTAVVPLIVAVTFHEVAHGFAAWKMGDPTAKMAGRITLNPIRHLDVFGSLILPLLLKLTGSPILFGYAKPVPVNFSNLRPFKLGCIVVAAAGPGTNLALATLSGVLFRVLFSVILQNPAGFGNFFVSKALSLTMLMLFYSVMINCVLAVFNLVPIPPLDGSRIVSMFLSPTLRMQYARLERWGMLIILALLVTGSFSRILIFFTDPLMRLFLGNRAMSLFFGT